MEWQSKASTCHCLMLMWNCSLGVTFTKYRTQIQISGPHVLIKIFCWTYLGSLECHIVKMIIVISEIIMLQRRNSVKKKKAYDLWRKDSLFNTKIVFKKRRVKPMTSLSPVLFSCLSAQFELFFLRFGPKINLFCRWTCVPLLKSLSQCFELFTWSRSSSLEESENSIRWSPFVWEVSFL